MRRPPTLREAWGAVWALRAVRSARRQLRRTGYEGIVLPPVPRHADSAARGVRAVLRRLPATCLERAVILQRWRAAQGDPHDVVVGVIGPGEGFRAHAWLDDEEPADREEYSELLRIRP